MNASCTLRPPILSTPTPILGRKVWDQTCQLFPQLKDHVEYFDVGTPLTNSHYLQSDQVHPLPTTSVPMPKNCLFLVQRLECTYL